MLIVEDESIIRKGLMFTVDWTAMKCIVVGDAADGEEGLMLAESLRPDLVLTDIRMPKLDGLEMLKEARQKQMDFEVIILSGYSDFTYAQQAITMGAFGYILKPVDEKILREMIENVSQRINEKKEFIHYRLMQRDADSQHAMNSIAWSTDRHVAKVLAYIEAHYTEKISLEQLALQIGVSSGYLSRQIKSNTSYTFMDILNRYRINKSTELLIHTDLKVYEISEMVGFTDYKHFVNVFKKYIGFPPTEFVKTHRLLTNAEQFM